MKTLFLDLGMGAAGDMLTAALYELIENKEDFINEINAAGIPGAEVKAEDSVRCGIRGTHMHVLIDGYEEISEDAGHTHIHEEHGPGHEHHHEGHEHHHVGHEHGGEDHFHDHESEEHGRFHSHGEDGSGHEHCHEEHEHGHHHHHTHRSMADIEAVIDSLNVSGKVRGDVKAVYKIIADAESKAHGMSVSEIHFHEVGTADAVADITAVCMLMEKLSPDKIIVSPVCTGFGHVRASHGVIPVPAPATAYILEKIPSYEGDIEAELCTPTGAALVKYFADEYGRMPVLADKKTGYGMGTKEFKKCNALRAVFGQTPEEGMRIREFSKKAGDSYDKKDLCEGHGYTSAEVQASSDKNAAETLFPGESASGNHDGKIKDTSSEVYTSGDKDKVIELSLTVDDMTGEEIGFACERIFAAGALDVYTRPVFMKKNRPGTVIDVLVKEEEKGKIVSAIFKHTTTLGIRQALCERYILKRDTGIAETEAGPVRIKYSGGYGTENKKPEYEDLAAIAAKRDKSLFEIKEMLKENSGKAKG